MIYRLGLAAPAGDRHRAPAAAQERVSIGTGGTGGVFYAVGAGMADIIEPQLDGVTANAEVTGASIENIRRVSAGEMTMGFSSASTLYEGKTGDRHLRRRAAERRRDRLSLSGGAADRGHGRQRARPRRRTWPTSNISIGPPGSNSSVLSERLLTRLRRLQHGQRLVPVLRRGDGGDQERPARRLDDPRRRAGGGLHRALHHRGRDARSRSMRARAGPAGGISASTRSSSPGRHL